MQQHPPEPGQENPENVTKCLNQLYVRRQALQDGLNVRLSLKGKVVASPQTLALPKGPRITIGQPGPWSPGFGLSDASRPRSGLQVVPPRVLSPHVAPWGGSEGPANGVLQIVLSPGSWTRGSSRCPSSSICSPCTGPGWWGPLPALGPRASPRGVEVAAARFGPL